MNGLLPEPDPAPPPSPPRRRRAWRWVLVALVLLILLPLGGLGLFVWRFDPDTLKPQIAQAVLRATGRQFRLDGPLRLALQPGPGPVPQLVLIAQDVALANLPGGTRPDMLLLRRMQLRVAWWPLLHGRIAIANALLGRPDLWLETLADGQPNWQFTPLPRPPSAPGGAVSLRPRAALAISQLHIANGVVHWRDGRTGHVALVRVPELTLTLGAAGRAPMHLVADLRVAGVPVTLDARAASWRSWQDDTRPWPLTLHLEAAGAWLSVAGEMLPGDAARRRMARLHIEASAAALEALNRIFQHANLPPWQNLRLSLRLVHPMAPAADLARPIAWQDWLGQMRDLHVQIGAATLPLPSAAASALLADLAPAGPVSVDLVAPAPGQDVELHLAGTAAPWHLGGSFGPASALWRQDLPLHLALRAGAGAAADDIVVQATLLRQGGPVRTLTLRPLHVAAPAADLAGEATLLLAPHPSLQATLHAARLDMDRLDMDRLHPAAPPAAIAPSAPTAPPTPVVPNAPEAAWQIPRTALPYALLHLADADLHLSIGQLRSHGLAANDISAQLLLAQGDLLLRVQAAAVPPDIVQLHIAAAPDAAPPITLQVQVQDVDAAAMAALFGQTPVLGGRLDIDAALQAAGASPHDLASALSGHAGLALVDGWVADRVLVAPLGRGLRDAGAGALAARFGAKGGGRIALRCAALRLDMAQGQAKLAAFAIDTPTLALDGGGSADLAAETLALQLRPLLLLGGTGVAVPVTVSGGFAAPRLRLAGPDGAPHGATAVIGALSRAEDRCVPALLAARNGRAGLLPPPEKANKPADLGSLLRGLLR